MAALPRPLWFRLICGALVALLSLVLLLCLAAWWLLATPSGAKWLLGTALPYAQEQMPDDLHLDIEGVEADTLASIRIAKLSLSDKEGVWLEAERLALTWSPTALWHGVFDAKEVSAARIHFLRPPISEPAPQRSPQEQADAVVSMLENLPDTLQDYSLPPLRIRMLRVDELALNSSLVDMPSSFTFSGTLDLTATPIQLVLDLHSLQGVSTKARVNISDAALAVNWKEESGGMLGNLLQLATPAPVIVAADSTVHKKSLTGKLIVQAGQAPLARVDIRALLLKGESLSWEASLLQPSLLTPLSDFPAAINASGQLHEGGLHLHMSSERFASLHHATAQATLRINQKTAPLMLEAHASAKMHQEGKKPQRLQFMLYAQGDAAVWDIATLNVMAGEDTGISASGRLHLADGDASMEGMLFLPPFNTHYEVEAKHLWDTPQAKAELTLETLKQSLPAPLDRIVTYPLTLQAKTVDNDTAVPDVEWTLEGDNLNGSGAVYPTAAEGNPLAVAEVHVVGLPLPLTLSARHMPSGNGHAEARSEGISLSSDYAMEGNLLKLSRILLDVGKDMRLAGDVTVNTASMLASGSLDGYLRSTAPLASLGIAAPDLRATDGKTNLSLSHPQGIQQASLRYASGKLDMDDATLAGDVDVQADLRLPPEQSPAFSGSMKAKTVTSPVTLDTWELAADGHLDRLQLVTTGANDALKTRFSAKGTLALEESTSLLLSSLTANWQENRLALEKPATLSYGDKEIRLSDMALRINGKPAITANAQLTEDHLDGRLTIDRLPLQVMPFGAFSSMKGIMDSKLTLGGSAGNPNARLVMDVDGLQNNYPHTTRIHKQPLMVTLRAELAQQVLSAQLSANAPDAQSFAAASLKLPVNVSLAPDNVHFATKGPVDAGLRADLVLGPFLPLFMPDGVYGTGHLIADLILRGQLDKPTINGSVDLHSGRIEVLQTGTAIDAFSFKAAASGNRITVSDGKATDGGKGSLTFDGTVRITPTMPMDIAAEVHKFVVMRHPNATATLSGDTTLKGDLTKALLKGDWHVDGARITILNTGNGDVPEIRVVEVASLDEPVETPEALEMSEKELNEARAKRRKERPFARNLAMKIGITADNQIFLDGFGLTAELKGKVDISGTAARPALGGQMETVRGRWEFFGKTFTITQGKAILSENNLTAPLIDISAETRANDITAIARITGTTTNPVIEFSSIPSLPKDEILARVMFGTNLNSISPYQALQLADMLRSLSGKGGSINPLSKLQNTLGIDELKINNESGNSEDVTVGVGKYLKENIYLEVEGGAGEESGKVSIEVDLTPRISVETETRQNAESAVRLNYKFDY